MVIFSKTLNAEITVSYTCEYHGIEGHASILFTDKSGEWDKIITMQFTPLVVLGDEPVDMNPVSGSIKYGEYIDAIYVRDLYCNNKDYYPQLMSMIQEELQSLNLKQDK
jgi:hypothetical protein